jgi:hypothetical protein
MFVKGKTGGLIVNKFGMKYLDESIETISGKRDIFNESSEQIFCSR